jgi:acyl-CoA synthetase (AMP-forming)/AMP-acid ligase II
LGIAITDGVDFVTVALSGFRQGLVVVPIDWRSKPQEKSALLVGFGLRALVVPAAAAVLPAHVPWPPTKFETSVPAAQEIGPEDPAIILLSSGTTGAPSGAVIAHSALDHRIVTGGSAAFSIAGNRYLSCLPLCFSMGFSMVLRNLVAGNPVLVHPPLFSTLELVAAVRKFGATYIGLVPTIVRSLLQLSDNELDGLRGLRSIRISGSAMSPEEKRECVRRIGARPYHGYGASAFGPICHWSVDDLDRDAGCVGKPYDWVTFRIVDAEDREVPPGTPGLLQLKGPTLASELLSIDGEVVSLCGSWYSPGDVVRMDSEGYLYIVGRATDVIIRGGINVYPEFVESAIRMHPSVADVAVVGRAAEGVGEEVVACVTTRAPLSAEDLLAHCRLHLSSKYQPYEVRIVQDLPRTAAGKVKRSEVRRLLEIPADIDEDRKDAPS